MCQFHYIPIYKFSLYRNKKINLNGSEEYFKLCKYSNFSYFRFKETR